MAFTFTLNQLIYNHIPPSGEEVKAKIQKHWTRARGKSIFNRFYPDANLQKKDEHFEQMTFPQKRSSKITTLRMSDKPHNLPP